VPVRRGPYLYYTRIEAGEQYRRYCRRRGEDGPEELLIDGNALAAGQRFFRLGFLKPSPDQSKIAYGIDTDGSLTNTLYLKDLASGELLDAPVANVGASVEWGEDGRTIFYSIFDQAHRPFKLLRHTLGADPADDALVHHEEDERFFVYISKTRSRAFLVLTLHSHGGNELRLAPADQPDAPFRTLAARRPNIEYKIEHHGERLLIASNDGAENFRLLAAPAADPDPAAWVELIAHRPDTLIAGLDAFAGHLVVHEWRGGLRQLRLSDPDGANVRYVAFPEPVYTYAPGENPEFDSATLRISYSSLVTPDSVVDYDMLSGAWQVRKQDEIPSGYDPRLYVSERLEATAPDGARVPISLVYRRDRPRDAAGPCLLTGYGAYGFSSDPSFSSNRLSLIDRGFVVAIAHIRGGSELGRAWYEQGRLLHKKNTFGDFIACAEQLIADGYTSPAQLAISGTSAGGLLVSAAANARPELFRAVLARVPWTNVIAAMVKPDLPLTVIEWEQWGNPADEEQYRYMRSYDPYEQVAPQSYPHIMATAGLNDLQVPYWDPAKWVARLRATKTDSNLLLLRMNLAAGHGGASGRFSYLEEIAEEYAFILLALGLAT
jgi:oligopeptidase B